MSLDQSVIHRAGFTIRTIEGPAELQQDALDVVFQVVEFAIREWHLPGHLFITLIGAETIASSPEDCGFAVYHAGIQHVAICGGKIEDEDLDHEHWLDELRMSTAHELAHYRQDMDGTLGEGGPEAEDEAEEMARNLLARLRQVLAD